MSAGSANVVMEPEGGAVGQNGSVVQATGTAKKMKYVLPVLQALAPALSPVILAGVSFLYSEFKAIGVQLEAIENRIHQVELANATVGGNRWTDSDHAEYAEKVDKRFDDLMQTIHKTNERMWQAISQKADDNRQPRPEVTNSLARLESKVDNLAEVQTQLREDVAGIKSVVDHIRGG